MEAQNDQLEHHLKHEMVMKRWASLYDHEGVQKLKKAMMRHVYKLKHGEEVLKTTEDSVRVIILLTFKMGINKINNKTIP